MTTKHDALFNALSPQKAWKDLYVPLCNILETSFDISIAGIHRLIMAYARLPILLYFHKELYMFDPVQNPQTGMVLVPNVSACPNSSPEQILAHNNYLYVFESTSIKIDSFQRFHATGMLGSNLLTTQTIYRSNLNSIVQFEQKSTTPIEWELFLRYDDTVIPELKFERFAFWRGSLISVGHQKQKDGNRKLIVGVWNHTEKTQQWRLRSLTEQPQELCENQNSKTEDDDDDDDDDDHVRCLVVDHDTLWIASNLLRVESLSLANPTGIFKSYKPKEDFGCCWFPQAVRTGFLFTSCHSSCISFSFQTQTWEEEDVYVGSPAIQIDRQYDLRLSKLIQRNDPLFLSFCDHEYPDKRCITTQKSLLVTFEGSALSFDREHLVYI
jgi:hypothetical protein